MKFIDEWKLALDKNHVAGAVFMDLSKAFDCLPRGLLLAKLHAYGLTASACDMFYDYLSDRKQRVKISNTRSSWALLSKGVPQGSILGPLFINDMFFFIDKCDLFNCADDNTLFNSSPRMDIVISNLEHDCKKAITWFESNGMEANANKFQFMLSTSRSSSEICHLNNGKDTIIKSEPFVKVLGVFIDENLTFSDHVSSCCIKAARQLNALARIAKHLDLRSRKIIYSSFIMSNFNFCPMVWHFCGKMNNNKMEKLHERSMRIVHNDFSSSYSELLQKGRTTTILAARLKQLVVEVFKAVNGFSPPCVSELFHTQKYFTFPVRCK